MKLFNAIAMYDFYIVANDSEAARAAMQLLVRKPDIEPSELIATETTRHTSVRTAWRDQPPYIARDITDDELKPCEGLSTIEIFEHLYCKRG